MGFGFVEVDVEIEKGGEEMFEIYCLIKDGKVVYVGIKDISTDLMKSCDDLKYDYYFILDSFESFESCFESLQNHILKNKLVEGKMPWEKTLESLEGKKLEDVFGGR